IVRKIQFLHEKEIDKLKDSTEAGGGSFSFVNVLLLKLLIKDNGGFLPATLYSSSETTPYLLEAINKSQGPDQDLAKLGPFDRMKKKTKKKVVIQDPVDDVVEQLTEKTESLAGK
ncbi:hypothetical protein Tco_0961071, partial [Tanacetum coccineum]